MSQKLTHSQSSSTHNETLERKHSYIVKHLIHEEKPSTNKRSSCFVMLHSSTKVVWVKSLKQNANSVCQWQVIGYVMS